MAAISALLVIQDVVAQRAGGAACGRCRRTQPQRAYGLVLAAFVDRRRLHRRCCRCSGFALPPRCSSRCSRSCWSGRRRCANGRSSLADRGRHGGRHLSCLRSAICRCCCRAAAGRAGDPCSICSAAALDRDPALEISGAVVHGHAGRRRRRLAAGRHDHDDHHRAPAVHLRAGPAGGPRGDDRRLCRRIGGRAHHRCLLGIPGTPSAIATTFDGFPMARNGRAGARDLARRVGVRFRRAAGRRCFSIPGHRAAGGHRAGVRPVGVLLAVRPGDGDGGRADGSLAGQGAALDGHRPAHHGDRHRSDRQACRASRSAPSSSAAAFRSCPF